jgi:hypothetical protein
MNCLSNTLPIWVTMSADCCTTIDPSCEDDDDADDDDYADHDEARECESFQIGR